MILVIGGAGQGKLAWTLAHSGHGMEAVTGEVTAPAPILRGMEERVREALERGEDPRELLPLLLEKEYVLCREVGCGLVPVDPLDRRWREEVGRLSCLLAKEAEGVMRLWCGIPQWLKGGKA